MNVLKYAVIVMLICSWYSSRPCELAHSSDKILV